MFESGRFNIHPDQLSDVIAFSFEGATFASELLCYDPGSHRHYPGILHLVGNTGHAGMVFIVSPREPRTRQSRHGVSTVTHQEYSGEQEDTFNDTSLHLSFTDWKVPLDWEHTGDIDQETFLLETLDSVCDGET
jgi:hypothetical protein